MKFYLKADFILSAIKLYDLNDKEAWSLYDLAVNEIQLPKNKKEVLDAFEKGDYGSFVRLFREYHARIFKERRTV